MLGPDEPRYAAIGRAMAQTGDFITPKLWGSPWFEKPPLLYWMTAAGTAVGLDAELAARLPIAILSLLFLAASFVLLHREFGLIAAAVSVALLATSVAWFTYSQLGLTDLPLAVFFSLAVLLALPLLRAEPETAHLRSRLVLMGVSIGLAMLAKGLVPIALCVPFFWFLRRFFRQWWLAIFACIIVAAPWYFAVYRRNGAVFIQDFLLKHHVERLYSQALQHAQPWYYFVPVILAGFFPWTPLIAVVFFPHFAWDQRRRFLAAVFCFGLIFFSASLNKLPGYVLPLFPSAFALIGAYFENYRTVSLNRVWLLSCAFLIALLPLLTSVLPKTLAAGHLSLRNIRIMDRAEWFYIILPIIVVFIARRSLAGPLLVLSVVAAGLYVKTVVDPVLDHEVSARGLWREVSSASAELCDAGMPRNWLYGLSFYRGVLLQPCTPGHFRIALRSRDHAPPSAEALQ